MSSVADLSASPAAVGGERWGPTVTRALLSVALLVVIVLSLVSRSSFLLLSLAKLVLVVGAFPLVWAVTEHERLPAGARRPRSLLAALAAAPWIGGGGRGALFVVLHLGLLAVAALAVGALDDGLQKSRIHLLIVCAFAAIHALLPTAVSSAFQDSGRKRGWMRIGMPLGTVVVFVGAEVASSAAGSDRASLFAQCANPWTLGGLFTPSGKYVGVPEAPWIVAGLAALAVIASVPRIVRGVREVLALPVDAR